MTFDDPAAASARLPSSIGDYVAILDLFAAVDLVLPTITDHAHRMTHRATTGVGLDDAQSTPFNVSSAVWSDVVVAVESMNSFALLAREAGHVPRYSGHALLRVAVERLASAL